MLIDETLRFKCGHETQAFARSQKEMEDMKAKITSNSCPHCAGVMPC